MPPLRPSTRFDLHLHSLRSDGRYAPEEVLLRCAAAGLDVVALTDHDLANDVPPGDHQVGGRTLRVLAGAEISGVHEGREQHLLVYFPGEVPPAFRMFCAEQCRLRASRYATAVENLALPGLPPPDEVALRGDAALTRHHLARHLVASGHVSTVRDAFARYLADSFGNVPPIALPFTEAIRFARAQGGVTSWAHPPLAVLEAFLPAFTAAGLQGIEALRPCVSSDARHRYRAAARRHGLVLTGGSDWHGWTDEHDLGLFRVEAREIASFVDLLLAA
jgi:3',5'-nucleoside bisphosphate phosphatase